MKVCQSVFFFLLFSTMTLVSSNINNNGDGGTRDNDTDLFAALDPHTFTTPKPVRIDDPLQMYTAVSLTDIWQPNTPGIEDSTHPDSNKQNNFHLRKHHT